MIASSALGALGAMGLLAALVEALAVELTKDVVGSCGPSVTPRR
ncbi:MAG: hypothetical protein V4669_14405 [Pseudomonadota bacterium]